MCMWKVEQRGVGAFEALEREAVPSLNEDGPLHRCAEDELERAGSLKR